MYALMTIFAEVLDDPKDAHAETQAWAGKTPGGAVFTLDYMEVATTVRRVAEAAGVYQERALTRPCGAQSRVDGKG